MNVIAEILVGFRESLYRGSLEGQCQSRLLNCFAALERLRLLRVGYVQRLFGKHIRVDE